MMQDPGLHTIHHAVGDGSQYAIKRPTWGLTAIVYWLIIPTVVLLLPLFLAVHLVAKVLYFFWPNDSKHFWVRWIDDPNNLRDRQGIVND